MKKLILAVLATGVISCALFTQNAMAVLSTIQGEIDFAGTVNYDTGNRATAGAVSTWYNIIGTAGVTSVSLATGDFSGIALGSDATMATPWTFNPSTVTPGLWSVGGFTFNLASSVIVTQNAGFLNITGLGTITNAGFLDTAGSWSFTSTGGSSKFAFTASTSSIPDGGSAVALLGVALAGIEGARRMFRARKA